MNTFSSPWQLLPFSYRTSGAVLVILFVTIIFAPAVVATPSANTTITNAVADDSGEQTFVVRFSEPNQLPVGAADAKPVGKMQMKATSSQDPFERFVAGNSHVTIKDSFWITNAMLVEVDTNHVSLDQLTTIENVRKIHTNFKISARNTGSASMTDIAGAKQVSNTNTDYTWGLRKIGTPKTWQQFDNRGDGVSVAVLDTGVDSSHPDVDVTKWKDFEDSSFDDGDNDSPSSVPKDYGTHGTHVSGTVVGGNASGTHIGVAPNATLYAGAVLTESEESGYFNNIINGMEWAVEQDADILSMSLGGNGVDSEFIEPVRNVRQAGTIPTIAVGNTGEGNSSFPGNVYDSIAIGASNPDSNIASFSGGETIYKNEWEAPPTDWPSSYVVPDVSAPGTSVYSSMPNNEYDTLLGTSMATPHVSGGLALIISNGHGDLTPTNAQRLLEDTAVDLGEDENRQGAGEIDIYSATTRHSWNTLQPTLSPTKTNVSVQTRLTASVNHPISTYYWTLPNGSTVKTTDETLSYSFEQRDAAASVTIVFQDIRGQNKTMTKTVDVGDAIAPTPVVMENRSSAELGIGTIQFNASRSTDNDRIDQYNWSFGDGTSRITTDPVVNHTYNTRGSQTVTLTITDAVGNSNTTTTTVDIVDTTKPQPRVTAPESTVVGNRITLNASGSIDNGRITNFEWLFEDGTTKSGEAVTHIFQTTGSQRITLKTTDQSDNTNTTQISVTVVSTPEVNITEPRDGSYSNTKNVSVGYSLSSTTGSEAAALQYQVTSSRSGNIVTDWQPADFTNTTNPVTDRITVGPLTDGNYTISFRIVDQESTALPYASSTANVSAAIKTTPPATTLAVESLSPEFDTVGPNNPLRINSSVTDPLATITTLNVTDQAGKTVFSWDLSAATGNGSYTIRRWNGTDQAGTNVDNGRYIITLTADDGVGNTDTTMTNVTVDTAVPDIEFSSLIGGTTSDETRYLNSSSTLDITVTADSNGQRVTSAESVTVEVSADTVNYRITPTMSQIGDDSIQWTGEITGETIEEPGAYTLTATATDSANNTNTTSQSLVYDPTPPELSAVITEVDPDTDTASVRVQANEKLVSPPTVQVTRPGGEITSVDLTASGNHWTGTFDVPHSGQYTLRTSGTDQARNQGVDKAVTTIDSDVTTNNGTVIVSDERSGVFIQINTTTAITDQTVALTTSKIPPEELERTQFGIQFFKGALDPTISTNLTNATIGFPATPDTLPSGISIDDERIRIDHYDNGWSTEPTRLTTVNKHNGDIEGPYWTTTVDSFSTYGIVVNDTRPPELGEPTATLSEDEQTVTLAASYTDDLTGVNASSIRFSIDGVDQTMTSNTSITSSKAIYTGYPVGDKEYKLTITVEDKAGNIGQYNRKVPLEPSEPGSPSSGTGGGSRNGAGGVGGSGTDSDTEADEIPPTVQQVRDTLNLVDPDTDTTTEIIDGDLGRPGVSVSPEGTELVRNINFSNKRLTGSVNIREYNNPPQTLKEQVSASIADQVDGLTDNGETDKINIISIVDIMPTTEQTQDTSATVELSIQRNRVDNPEQLTVIKEGYDFESQADRWGEINTEVVNLTEKEVILEAEVTDFSIFAITEAAGQDSPEQVTAPSDSGNDNNDETEDSGINPIAFGGVVVLALFAMAAVAYRKVN